MVKQKRNKTEVLHVRLDDKTKFAVDLISKQRMQKATQVVEAAIRDNADGLDLGVPWTALWDPDEGVRTLNLLACPRYRATPDEEEIRAFTLAHKEFFYSDEDATIPHRGFVSLLWPKLQHHMELWRAKRHENYWIAAEAMEAALKHAKVKAPERKKKR